MGLFDESQYGFQNALSSLDFHVGVGMSGKLERFAPGLEYVAIHIRNILQILTSSSEILCFGNTRGSAVTRTNRRIVVWISA
jgi:hypothetical protein